MVIFLVIEANMWSGFRGMGQILTGDLWLPLQHPCSSQYLRPAQPLNNLLHHITQSRSHGYTPHLASRLVIQTPETTRISLSRIRIMVSHSLLPIHPLPLLLASPPP